MSNPKSESVLDHADAIAYGTPEQVPLALSKLKDLLESMEGGPVDIDLRNANGMRALDALARGRDSEEACYAVVYLAQAGASLDEQPSSMEAPPAHAAAYYGNWQILNTLVDLGADVKRTVNAMKQQLLGSTPIHAVATGFRAARADDFAECFAALLAAGVDIDARDRKRQSAIDIAMKSAANTGNSTLSDAMLSYGVNADGPTAGSASKIARAIMRKTGNAKILAQLSHSAITSIQRAQSALKLTDQVRPLDDEETPESGIKPLSP